MYANMLNELILCSIQQLDTLSSIDYMITIHSTVPLTTFMKYLIVLLVVFEQADSYEVYMTPCLSYNDTIKLKTQTDLNK